MKIIQTRTVLLCALLGTAVLSFPGSAKGDICAPSQSDRVPDGTANIKVTATGSPAGAVADAASANWNNSCSDLPEFGSTGTVPVVFKNFSGNCPGCSCGFTDAIGTGSTIQSATVWVTSHKADGTACTLAEKKESGTHELGHLLGLGHGSSDDSCEGRIMKPKEPGDPPRSVKSADCTAAQQRTNQSPSGPECYSDSNCNSSRPYCVAGSCVECRSIADCPQGGYITFHGDGLTIPTSVDYFEGAQYSCSNGFCVAVSPLVIYLPDYTSTLRSPQSWWRDLCDADAPPVCLDWRGDGNITCTGWTAPDNEDIGFITALGEEELASLASGPLTVEPSRHLFGNVTRGLLGDFPYQHGFDALAAYCGQSGVSEIDLSSCGERLFVWVDDGDGAIAAGELRPFGALGIQSLGQVRKVGKGDKCGNRDLFESHAKCLGRPGQCGTWVDIFFAPVGE